MSPIMIPSKGRPNASALKLFPESIIFVEPQDYPSYKEQNPNSIIKVLPENDQGISYVRQAILDYALARKINHYWMLDDDLKFFYEIVDRKTVKIDPHAALEKAEALIKYIPNLAQASLDYTQFAWSASKEIKLNSYCDCCVYINTKLASAAKYRSEIELKEDRDFSMQLLAAGFNTARISKYAFHSPKNGSNNGGLKKLYDIPGKEEEVCHKVVNIWGEKFCTVQKKKNGRTDLKINWKGLLAYGQQNRLMHNQILH